MLELSFNPQFRPILTFVTLATMRCAMQIKAGVSARRAPLQWTEFALRTGSLATCVSRAPLALMDDVNATTDILASLTTPVAHAMFVSVYSQFLLPHFLKLSVINRCYSIDWVSVFRKLFCSKLFKGLGQISDDFPH